MLNVAQLHDHCKDDPRSSQRQRLVKHLHAAGERPVLEALLAVEAGQPLDAVLEDFARIPVATYRQVGADQFLADRVLQ